MLLIPLRKSGFLLKGLLNQSHSNSISPQESIFLTPSHILHSVIFYLDSLPSMSDSKKWPTPTMKWVRNEKPFTFYTYLNLCKHCSNLMIYLNDSYRLFNLKILLLINPWCNCQLKIALTLYRVKQRAWSQPQPTVFW